MVWLIGVVRDRLRLHMRMQKATTPKRDNHWTPSDHRSSLGIHAAQTADGATEDLDAIALVEDRRCDAQCLRMERVNVQNIHNLPVFVKRTTDGENVSSNPPAARARPFWGRCGVGRQERKGTEGLTQSWTGIGQHTPCIKYLNHLRGDADLAKQGIERLQPWI